MSVNWFEVNGQPMSFGPWLPAYFKPMNTHPTLGEGQNGKIYGSGPDPFPPPRNKRERVCYARLIFIGIGSFFGRCSKMGCAPPVDVSGPLSSSLSGTSMDISGPLASSRSGPLMCSTCPPMSFSSPIMSLSGLPMNISGHLMSSPSGPSLNVSGPLVSSSSGP